jgi:hypothetical protein
VIAPREYVHATSTGIRMVTLSRRSDIVFNKIASRTQKCCARRKYEFLFFLVRKFFEGYAPPACKPKVGGRGEGALDRSTLGEVWDSVASGVRAEVPSSATSQA